MCVSFVYLFCVCCVHIILVLEPFARPSVAKSYLHDTYIHAHTCRTVVFTVHVDRNKTTCGYFG